MTMMQTKRCMKNTMMQRALGSKPKSVKIDTALVLKRKWVNYGKLRESFPNTVAVCAHLYKDLSLRDDLRMVATATRFFMTEYSDVLSVLKMSQDLQGVSNAGIVKLNRKTNNIDKMFQGMSYVSII